MTFEQKVQAIIALVGPFNFAIRCRESGSWYVEDGSLEIAQGGLVSPTESADSPYAAVHEHWEKLTKLTSDDYLVLDAMGKNRRAVRWNGFMWADVREESK